MCDVRKSCTNGGDIWKTFHSWSEPEHQQVFGNRDTMSDVVHLPIF